MYIYIYTHTSSEIEYNILQKLYLELYDTTISSVVVATALTNCLQLVVANYRAAPPPTF